VASATTANEDDTRRIVKAALERVMVNNDVASGAEDVISTCQSEREEEKREAGKKWLSAFHLSH